MKPFFDVFPTLKVKADLRDYFAETEVERLTTNKEHTRIKVVLHSGHLIHKQRIYRMQEEISGQVFGERAPEIYIDEHYSLSAQYTPRRLMEEYHDSLVSEIESFSHVMGLLFREASVEFKDEDRIRIVMEDSCLSRKMSFRLEEALNRIFRERCGVQATITVTLQKKEAKPSAERTQRVRPLQGAEAAFTIREGGESELPPWDPAAAQQPADRPEEAAPKLAFRKKEENAPEKRSKGFAKNGSGASKKPFSLKRSNHPDVIYGREVNEDAIPIADIVGEIGEVVVRGRIIANSSRDIRNDKTIVKFSMTDLTDSIYCKLFVPTAMAGSSRPWAPETGSKSEARRFSTLLTRKCPFLRSRAS